MDKILSCVERIRIIRGVNHGVITNKKIQDLFIIYDLDEQQRKSVFEILEKDMIIPVSEEIPQKVQASNAPSQSQAEHRELDEQTSNVLRKERFDMMLDKYKQAIKDNPDITKRYEDEIPIFAKAIIEQNDERSKTASRIITRAVMAISSYRGREARKRGWVCGTYMSRVRKHFECWLRDVFAEEQLSELITCFAEGKELTQEQEDMLRVLIHNTPKTLVNRWYFDLLDD